MKNKKVFAALLSVVILISSVVAIGVFSVSAINIVTKSYTLGDVNMDGKLNIVDAKIISKVSAGKMTAPSYYSTLGDVNSDGRTNVKDATEVQKCIVGKVSSPGQITITIRQTDPSTEIPTVTISVPDQSSTSATVSQTTSSEEEISETTTSVTTTQMTTTTTQPVTDSEGWNEQIYKP